MIPESSTLIATGLSALADQNPFRPGRVSPGRVVDGPGFKVRHLAFAAGAELTEHSAPVPLLVQVLSGSVRFRIGGVDHPLTAGAVFYVAAGDPHAVVAEEDSRVLLILVG